MLFDRDFTIYIPTSKLHQTKAVLWIQALPPDEREGVAEQAKVFADIGAAMTLFSIMVENNAYLSLMSNTLKRRAVLELPQLGEDPLQVCQTYLESDDGYTADAINQGVADVIRAYSPDLPREAVQALVERGIKIPKLTTRKAFFRLGADLFGPDYLTRAQADKTKSIRDWATKQTAGPPKRQRKKKGDRR